MERLLTEEESNKFSREAERRVNDLQQSTGENFNSAYIEHLYKEIIKGIYLDAKLSMLKAQRDLTQRETLKAIGEWLNRNTACGDNQSGLYRAIKWEHIEALKRGEMPKEVTNALET
jgi:hypothetical protein